MRVDGPYGESSEKPAWVKHATLIIFAGGIGVGPFIAIRLLHSTLFRVLHYFGSCFLPMLQAPMTAE